MKIVIATRIYLPEPSAASFFLSSVATELSGRGHEVTVLTAAPPPGQSVPQRAETIKTFPVLRDKSGYVRGYVQYLSFDIALVFRLLFHAKPDVVLVEPPPTSGFVVRMICALRRIPYVYDAADLWSVAAVHATRSQFVLKALERVERWALGGARRIITISESVADRIRAWGIKKPIEITGRGADTESFRYTPETQEPLFVYAGSYSAWHGAMLAVEAFARFHESHATHRLRFIGHGTETEALLTRSRELGIEGFIEFHDPVSPAELAMELGRAQCSIATLLPGSGYEFAFATKTYSSLASGCPVIFAGPGPTGDFIKAASLRVGSAVEYDVDELATAMKEIAEKPLEPSDRYQIAQWIDEHHSMRAAASRAADAIEMTVEDGS